MLWLLIKSASVGAYNRFALRNKDIFIFDIPLIWSYESITNESSSEYT